MSFIGKYFMSKSSERDDDDMIDPALKPDTYSNTNDKDDNDPELGEQSTLLGKITSSVKDNVEVEVSYTYFFIVMGVGLLFIFISFLYAPFMILYPWKFSAFFSFGTFICLCSFIFIYGTCGFLEMLFKRERILYTLLYLSSLILGNVLTHFYTSYIIVLICTIIQLITIGIYTLTFIPGGYTGIKFLLSTLHLISTK